MKRWIVLTMCCAALSISAAEKPLSQDFQTLKNQFAKGGPWIPNRINIPETLSRLGNDGVFPDMRKLEQDFWKNGWDKHYEWNLQLSITGQLATCFDRLMQLSLAVRDNKIPEAEREAVKRKIFQAVMRYGKMELGRDRIRHARFHGSCFSIPTSAVWIYFSFRGELDAGKQPEVLRTLKALSFQAWSQPLRGDATDKNIVSVERFRHHVWWVGGNATGYRPLMGAALVNDSEKMLDVLAEVAGRSISAVSQNTYTTAFWNEGFTADGAGWGHGKQCLIWGYPIHGTNGSLNIMRQFKGTRWGNALDRSALNALFNYLRGSAFYFYKGTLPPVLDRYNANGSGAKKRTIPSLGIVNTLLTNFKKSLSPAEIAELTRFQSEAKAHNLFMSHFPTGDYHGTRYFFNNDDLIRKNPNYYVFVNMVSNRTQGLESAYSISANGYNLFTCDGQTLFERDGGESAQAFGSIKLQMLPGITARQVTALKSVDNWGGYGSTGAFAAGAVAPGQNAVAGFQFDKVNCSKGKEPNPAILNIRAVKGYFFSAIFFSLSAPALKTRLRNWTATSSPPWNRLCGKAKAFASTNTASTGSATTDSCSEFFPALLPVQYMTLLKNVPHAGRNSVWETATRKKRNRRFFLSGLITDAT